MGEKIRGKFDHNIGFGFGFQKYIQNATCYTISND